MHTIDANKKKKCGFLFDVVAKLVGIVTVNYIV